MEKKIGIIKGSLRQNSFSQSLADYIKGRMPAGLVFQEIDIGGLPLYNQDSDSGGPVEYTVFREKVRALDGLLFITPEHNRSIPAVLKNALDVGSRPYGQSVWNNKPGAVISQSAGGLGGFGANHYLRQVLTCLNVLTMAQPEAYIGSYHTLIDDEGALNNADTQAMLDRFLSSFKAWVEKLS